MMPLVDFIIKVQVLYEGHPMYLSYTIEADGKEDIPLPFDENYALDYEMLNAQVAASKSVFIEPIEDENGG